MKNEDIELMTDEELMRKTEELLHLKWKDQPATSKQKMKLKKLGVSFEKNLSKSHAFFLIREKVNGIRLPNNFV